MILNEYFTLSNGIQIPKIGLGTWMIEDSKVADVIVNAVQEGYRHFDTAQGYGNERGVGEGIRKCGVPREELFVTTKLEAGIKDYEDAIRAINASLEKAGLEYFDLMIIHSPQPWTDFREGEHFFEGNLAAWQALEEAFKAGKLRAIGVSNFERPDLDNLLENGTVRPMVNQILAHPGNTPTDLIRYTQSQGILVEAYSPVAHGKIFNRPELRAVADNYGVTIAQLCIRYCLQLGMLPLPKTVTPAWMRENAAVDFEITEADMNLLANAETFSDYGDAAIFPVYGGKLLPDGTCVAR
ncbi:aldo/keto reductase [Salmonella enterica subsp. enterica serovar Sandiego]|nr:aldo/keto reductase [Salmonella enterica]EDU6968686.1 aldo/keto reductase [Salmonella enterica subsp. enterica serovar Sandiego]EBH0655124.1 aldo/keto reductase [Salmonella enterica]EBN6187368.1 aldo/keto reductase [Salmonella enterica]ECF9145276.1 aldo/keto reductase [Salmonella enterica]